MEKATYDIYPENLNRFCNAWREIKTDQEIKTCRECPIKNCCIANVYFSLSLYPDTKQVLEDIAYIINNYPSITTLIKYNLL